MNHILITIYGSNIVLSSPSGGKLDRSTDDMIRNALTYEQKKLVRGAEAWDQFGQRRQIKIIKKVLCGSDGAGHIVCKAGLLERLKRIAYENGYEATVVNKTPMRPAERFVQDWNAVFDRFELRARQEEMLLKLVSCDRGIVEAPPGFGKSYAFRMLAAVHPNARILIVVGRMDIADDIYRELSGHFPNIGIVKGGKRKLGRITVCMALSLHHINPNDWDIVLCDEAHELVAPTVVRELTKFDLAKMFGFSATPWGRQDGTSIRMENLFGDVLFRMTYPEAIELGLVVPICVEWLNVLMDVNPCFDYRDVPRLRHGLWRNDFRNKVIANKVRTYDDDEQVLIMVAHFEHAVYLKRHLPEFTLCYAERAEDDALFDRAIRDRLLPLDEPRMTDSRRRELRLKFGSGELKKTIATDVWSTGVNFQSLQVLVRADARRSSIKDMQLPGRVSRIHAASGKKEGRVIDLLDQFDEGFRDAGRARRRNYVSKGWTEIMPAGSHTRKAVTRTDNG